MIATKPEFHWFLPTYGDGRNIVNSRRVSSRGDQLRARVRESDPYYLAQLARAAEQAGFAGVLLPTGFSSEDTFIITALVAQETRRLEYIVAFRAGMTLPSVTAQMTATLQRATGGRVRLNITTGGSTQDQRAYGDFLEHDDRYRRTDEFLTVLGHLWDGKPFDYKGNYFQSTVEKPSDFARRPTIYFAGSSEIAKDIAARHADVYLMYGEPPTAIRQRVQEMRQRAEKYGRVLHFGIFIHVITRDTEQEAHAEAERHLESMDRASIETVQRTLSAMDSVGQERVRSLHGGRFGSVRDLLVYPNVWAGVGLVRGGGGTALLGSYEQVAERIDEYADAGLDTMIFNGYPALEEAYRVGELVLPRTARQQEQDAAVPAAR